MTLLFDFARTILFPKREYQGSLGKKAQGLTSDSILNHFVFNQELLDFIAKQQRNHQTAILSASETLLSMPIIRQKLEVYFDDIFLSKEIGHSKDIPACYLAVAKQLKIKPKQILFTDDTWRNVAAAQTAGCQAIQFTTTQAFIKDVTPYL